MKRVGGRPSVVRGSLVFKAGCLGVLLMLTGWRLVGFRSAVVDDFMDPRRAFGFFTFVAGTNVVGLRFAMAGLHSVTVVLLASPGSPWATSYRGPLSSGEQNVRC